MHIPFQFGSSQLHTASGGETLIDIQVQQEKMSRLKAADLVSKSMTVEEYMEYTKCLETNFAPNKIADWIGFTTLFSLLDEPRYSLHESTLMALAQIGREAVGVLTQESLIVKRGMLVLSVHDEKEENIGVAQGVMSPGLRDWLAAVSSYGQQAPRVSSQVASLQQKLMSMGLEPVHIMEAIRRLNLVVPSKIDFLLDRSLQCELPTPSAQFHVQ